MAYLLIEHDVADFDLWKSVYDEHEDARRKAGLRELMLLRDTERQGHVLILFEASDPGLTREFVNSDDLKKTMQRAGVRGRPVVRMLESAVVRRKAA